MRLRLSHAASPARPRPALQLWDVNMDSGPLATYPVHESLRGKVCGAQTGSGD